MSIILVRKPKLVPQVSYISATLADSAGSWTFTNASIGAVPSTGLDRYIFAVVAANDNDLGNMPDPTGGTIAGNSATLHDVASTSDANNDTAIAGILSYGPLNTGTTATVVVTGGTTYQQPTLAVFQILVPTGRSVNVYGTNTDTGTSLSAALTNVNQGDVILGGAACAGGASPPTGATWNTITERYDSTSGIASEYVSFADYTLDAPSASFDVSVTWTSGTPDISVLATAVIGVS